MRFIKNFSLIAFLFEILVACAGTPRVVDDWAVVEKARYVHDAAPSLTLITMINNSTGSGGHSSLLINSVERVMYDPAGRFSNSRVPERDDVLFGISPSALNVYNSFHARSTHHVVLQTIEVSPQVALQAYELALKQGSSADALCSNHTSKMLLQLDGFQGLTTSFWPHKLMEKFGKLPGVKTEKVVENDEGQN